jgi:uncharacterized protein YllA (UPF0747 family)
MMFRLGKFERKLLRHLKKTEEAAATRLRRAAGILFPERDLQERTLNGMSYLSRYGMDLIETLIQAVPESSGKHFMVELS